MDRHLLLDTVKRVLLYSTPFLLITAAVYLFAVWGVESFVEGSIYYRLVTRAPALLGDSDDNYLVLTEEKKKQLEENNEGTAFIVPPSFPAISIGEQWATITIESADVHDVPVFHGDSRPLLNKGVGHYTNSRFPGQHGKVVLAAHVLPDLFRYLETVSIGDIVTLNTIYGEYVYWVTDTVIFHQSDQSLIIPDGEDTGDKLICYTCYPYNTTSVRTHRFAIICELISGYDWTLPQAQDQIAGSNSAVSGEGDVG